MNTQLKTLLNLLFRKISGNIPDKPTAIGTVGSHLMRIANNISAAYTWLHNRVTKDYLPDVLPIEEQGVALVENSDNLVSHLHLLDTRKIECGNAISTTDGKPEIEDGVGLGRIFMSTYIDRITYLEDNSIGWKLDRAMDTWFYNYLFPSVTKIRLGCKEANVRVQHNNSNLTSIEFPYLENITEPTNHSMRFLSQLPNLTEISMPLLQSYYIDKQSCSLLYNVGCDRIELMSFQRYRAANGSSCFYGCDNLTEIITPNTNWIFNYGNVSYVYNCPKLKKLVIGHTGRDPYNNTTYDSLFAGATYHPYNMPLLIHLEFGAGGVLQEYSLYLCQWTPTMALRTDTTAEDYEDLREEGHPTEIVNNLQQFLYNFRKYLILRLADRTSKDTLTLILTQDVRNAVNNSTITLGSLGITSNDLTEKEVAASITTSTTFASWFNTYMSAINWNVSPTATN